MHLRELCADLGMLQDNPTILEEDNQSLIRITLNSGVDSDRIKHWDYKVHWLREKVQKGDILIIISYAQMDIDSAKSFNPTIVFPNELTNQLD